VDTFRLAEKESIMAKTRTYPPEFRHKVLELIRSGKSANAVAHEFEISRQTIANWQKQDDLHAGRRTDGLTTEESAEVTKLRRKVRELEMERDILKKAAAWFARETDSIPTKSSNS
jgi:transposase